MKVSGCTCGMCDGCRPDRGLNYVVWPTLPVDHMMNDEIDEYFDKLKREAKKSRIRKLNKLVEKWR